jgi:4-amino-4-deoxy-L-arabinose transferase-like glycosyltransferase
MIDLNFIQSKSYNQKFAILFMALAFIWLFGNNWVSFWDQDEAAYAGFAKTMIETGNWLQPDFMWSEVHRKPPLHFWNIAISYKIFGINEFAVRFPSVVFILGTIALIYLVGKDFFGEKMAFYAALILSTSILVPALAKVSVTDATLLFFKTLCAFSILKVLIFRNKWWVLLFWIGFSLALLTKGPPIIIFTGFFVLILLLFHPNRKNFILFHPWFFMPLAFLPLYIWGYWCMQTPDGKIFITWMIDWYILKRVGGSVFGQTGPPGTHLLGLLVFFIPYFVFFPKAIAHAIKNLFNKEKNMLFIASAWFVSAWFLYEITPSKLPAYVIAAHVPLSLFIAYLLANSKVNKGMAIAHFCINSLIYLVFIIAPIILQFPLQNIIIFAILGLIMSVFNVFTLKNYANQKFRYYLFTQNIVFQVLIWCFLLPLSDDIKNSSLRIAQFIEQNADKNAEITIANSHARPPSLPFYLKMRFKNVNENYDFESLSTVYENSKNHVFILNKGLKEEFENKFPSIEFSEIKPIFTDRIQQDSYFILIKN